MNWGWKCRSLQSYLKNLKAIITVNYIHSIRRWLCIYECYARKICIHIPKNALHSKTWNACHFPPKSLISQQSAIDLNILLICLFNVLSFKKNRWQFLLKTSSFLFGIHCGIHYAQNLFHQIFLVFLLIV